MNTSLKLIAATALLLGATATWAADTIKLGLNYPLSGRYKSHGFAQAEGALLAINEINAQGGVLGKQLELLTTDTNFDPARVAGNVSELVSQGAQMIMGGVSSEVSRATGREAQRHGVPYFAVQAYANELTGKRGHKLFFRENQSARMSAAALASVMADSLQGKTFFYITASGPWGTSTEDSMRRFTNTGDRGQHASIPTQYPKPRKQDLEMALAAADNSGADVLVLIQFGRDLANMLQHARQLGLHERMTIVVPTLDLETAQEIGASALTGVLATMPWSWNAPAKFGYQRGQAFVDAYSALYQHRPSAAAASAYSVVYQYVDAVRRANSVSPKRVVKALEGHRYQLLKGEQHWRSFDHQNEQSVLVVRGKPRADVLKGAYRSDFFEILAEVPASQVVPDYNEWLAERKDYGKPATLQ